VLIDSPPVIPSEARDLSLVEREISAVSTTALVAALGTLVAALLGMTME
jgi:hypothetical protein